MSDFSPIPADTTPEAFAVYGAAWRAMSFEDRARRMVELSDNLHALVLAGVRERHPDYGDREAAMAVLRLTLGDSQFHVLFPGVGIRT
jgi:hypothetical protein